MSGFEVVGLVLAVVPLLITALEEYQKFNRKRDVFFKRYLHIGRMIHALTECQILIEGDVEVLLRNAGFDGEMMEQIKAGKCLELLREDDVKMEVKALLGESRYNTYLQTLNKCEENLFHIAKEIGKLKQGRWV
jgi:hypothetical protein